MNTTKLMHVSPEMVDKEDMKNWNPEEWTRHLQEQVNHISVKGRLFTDAQVRDAFQQGNGEAPELATLVVQFFSDHHIECIPEKTNPQKGRLSNVKYTPLKLMTNWHRNCRQLHNCVDHYIATISNHYKNFFFQTTMFT